jgi:ABC-type dipeptide/oligopeptide/nickel transport system permease component
VIRNVVLIFSLVVVLVNFAVDLAYVLLDPRLRRSR